MREVDASLQQQSDQLARLQTENDRLAKLAAQTGSPNQLNDLLRLRGEVGLLRKQTNDLATLQQENRRLRSRNFPQIDRSKTPLQQKEEEMAKLTYSKYWLLAFLEFAESHRGQFPTNFDQALPLLEDDVKAELVPRTDQFEIIYLGSSDGMTNPANVIVIREKQAFQYPDGKWGKVFVFADGHSEIHVQADGEFDAWEKQRIIAPPDQ